MLYFSYIQFLNLLMGFFTFPLFPFAFHLLLLLFHDLLKRVLNIFLPVLPVSRELGADRSSGLREDIKYKDRGNDADVEARHCRDCLSEDLQVRLSDDEDRSEDGKLVDQLWEP